MQLENDNTVALERRMDLASLFCMIGRHGPAVVLAVIAMVSVVVGFIIYRTVKGKWRKATAGSDSKSPGAERDASLIQTDQEPEESRSSVESTDVRDGGWSDIDLIHSDVRHRRAAAAAELKPPPPPPPPYYPPESDSLPDGRHHAPAVQDCSKVTEPYSEDRTNHSPQGDTEAEVDVEADDDPHQGLTEERGDDDDSCVTTSPEPIHNGSYREEEQVLEEKCPRSENVCTGQDVSEEKNSEEEENSPDNPVCFEQNKANETLQQDEVTPETCIKVTNMEDSVIHNEEVSCVSDSKDDVDYSNNKDHISSEVETNISLQQDLQTEPENNFEEDDVSKKEILSSCEEEETKNECEKAAEECVDQQQTAQQVEIVYSSFEGETIQPSQQELCDDVIDVMVENTCEDHVSSLAECNVISLQKDLQTAQQVDTVYSSFEGETIQPSQQEELCDDVIDERADVMLENICEDHVSSLAECNVISLQQDLQTEPEENNFEEDDVLKKEIPSSCEEEETKNECEKAAEECVDQQQTAQQVEIVYSSFEGETIQPSQQEELCDDVIDVMVENTCEDHVSSLAECNVISLQQDLQTEPEENNFEEDDVLKKEEEEETKNECEKAAEECVDQQMIAQQVEIVCSSFEGEIIPPSAQEELCDDVIDKQGDDSLTVDVILGDHVSSLTECDVHLLQQDPQTEQENGFEDDGALKEQILTSCEEHDKSSVVCTPPLDAEEPEVVANVDDVLCSTQSDEKSQISDVDVLEVSTDFQQSQEAVEVKDELSDLKIFCPDLTSLKEVIPSEKNVTSPVVVLPEEGLPFCYKDQPSKGENEETFQNIRVTSATEVTLCDEETITASTEVSHPDVLYPLQDERSDQMQEIEDFTKVTPGASPDSIKTLLCPIQLQSFDQSELMSFGEESGISSMTVSPDLQDAGDKLVMTPENVQIPVVDCSSQFENQTEAHISLFADDAALSAVKGYTEEKDYSYAANEDTFGHEVEDSYHREMEQFMAQIVASVASLTRETTKKTDIKKEAEKEEEEEREKTEISIMEATMDNNEWITDGNCQVLPWMSLSTPSVVQNHTKTNPDPTSEHQHCPSPVDVTCIDTDIPNSVEVRHADTLPLAEENTENNKKVVAVQPMPQYVTVTFRIHYLTHSPFQTVAITGDHEELGNWKGFIPLERAKDGHWATVVSLPTDSHVEWKFVVLDKGEVCRWEECGNRLLDTGYGDDLLVHKWWGLL